MAHEFEDNVDNLEDIVEEIDIMQIDDEAISVAMSTVSNLSKIYYDDEFMDENPKLKERIDIEIENLRILIKMRKSDERTHDILLNAIAMNANNASLYRSLSQIQNTLLSIHKQIDETIKNITSILKGYQLEINFTSDGSTDVGMVDNISTNIHRGSKSFIEQMREKNKITTNFIQGQIDIFEPTVESSDE